MSDRLLPTECFENKVSTAHVFANRSNGIPGTRIDTHGGANSFRELQFFLGNIYSDYVFRSGNASSLNNVEADTAAPENDNP